MRNRGVKGIVCVVLGTLGLVMPMRGQQVQLGFLAGLSNCQGDLIKEDFSLRALHVAVGLESRLMFGRGLSVRGQFYTGTLSGDDAFYADRAHRGLSSKTSFLEFSLYGGYDVVQIFERRHKSRWALHGLIGAGLMGYEVEVLGNIEKGVYADTEHPLLNPSYGFGANLSFKLNDVTTLSYEMTHRTLMNDKIDGVSAPGTRGYDWFYLSNVTITTTL